MFNKKENFYIVTDSKKYPISYSSFIPLLYDGILLDNRTTFVKDLKNYKKSDAFLVNIPSKKLTTDDMKNYHPKRSIKLRKKDAIEIIKYDFNLKVQRVIPIDNFIDKELSRIEKNIQQNLDRKQKQFYSDIQTGKIGEINLHRVMSEHEYKKLISGKMIRGRIQLRGTSCLYGTNAVCFFDDNRKKMAEYFDDINAFIIVTFRAKVSDIKLTFGRYDEDTMNGDVREQWQYEWHIKKYNNEVLRIIDVKKFDKERLQYFRKLYSNLT